MILLIILMKPDDVSGYQPHHFTDEETETQNSYITHPGYMSIKGWSQDLSSILNSSLALNCFIIHTTFQFSKRCVIIFFVFKYFNPD